MKAVRILLFIGIVIAVLFAAAITLVFTPSVQTWAARKALAGTPDVRGEIGGVDVGLQRVELHQLHLVKKGLNLTVPSASIDVPVMKGLRKDVVIRKIVAKGWILDLTAPDVKAGASASAGTAASPAGQGAEPGGGTAPQPSASTALHEQAAFDGIFELLRLPVDLQVDEADLEGDVIFSGKPGQPPGRVHVIIAGGGLGAGKEGKFKLQSRVEITDTNTPVSELTSEANLVLRMDTPRTFQDVAASADLNARGAKLPNGAQLHAELKASRGAASEDYSLILRSLGPKNGKELARLEASYPQGTKILSGTWKIDAEDSDLAPFALGLAMPSFSAVSEGSFQSDSKFQEVRSSGKFRGSVARLEDLSPALKVIGSANLQGEFGLVESENSVRIDRFTTIVSTDKPILRLEALQPIEYDSKTKEFTVGDAKKELFRATIDGIPMDWLKPFLPAGLLVTGQDLRGEIVGVSQNGGLSFRSVSPLTLNGLSIAQDGAGLLEKVDVRTQLTGEFSGHAWQADVSELSVGQGSATWLKLALKAGQVRDSDQPLKATGQYEINLEEAGRQPVFKSLAPLTAGRATGDFTAVVSSAVQQIAAKVLVRDLAAPGAPKPVPTIDLNLRADVQADGLIKLHAPVVIQQGERKSDLDTVAEIRSSGTKHTIDAHVQSGLLYVEDLKALAAPFGGSPTGAAPTQPAASGGNAPATPGTGSAGADTKPFWSDLSGQVRLDLKKVVYSADVEAANVTGELTITPAAVTLKELRAVMGEGSSAKIAGGLTFNGKAKEPYALDADINVTNVDPGPLLAALNPSRQPTIEGQFDLVGKFFGESSSLNAMADSTAAELKLTSRGGKFHGFAASARGANLAKYQKAASTVGSILEMAAGVLGSEAGGYADKFRAATDTVKRLAEIDFDQLNLELSHRPGEALKVTDFSLISPDLRLLSTGSINTVQGVSWLNRPLHLEVQMAVRGDQAKNFAKLNLLKGTKDALGYVPLLEKFMVDGSIANLGSDALMKLITQAFASTK